MPKIEISEKDKQYNRFINSLRCPLCGAQLDGSVNPERSELECRWSPDEYSCKYINYGTEPVEQTVRVTVNNMEYVATCIYENNCYNTIIYTFDLTFANKLLSKKALFRFAGKIPSVFFSKNEKEFLQKLEIYKVFN